MERQKALVAVAHTQDRAMFMRLLKTRHADPDATPSERVYKTVPKAIAIAGWKIVHLGRAGKNTQRGLTNVAPAGFAIKDADGDYRMEPDKGLTLASPVLVWASDFTEALRFPSKNQAIDEALNILKDW